MLAKKHIKENSIYPSTVRHHSNTCPSYRLKGGEKNKYRFDFRPDSLTTLGVGKADIFVTQQYPVDRYGINRLTNDGPDIGAYEFVPKEDETK